MLSKEVTELALTERAPLTVFATKKDDSVRFCFDKQKCIAVTKQGVYWTPHIEKCIDLPGKAAVFSMLEWGSGYLQSKIENKSRDRKSFT